MPIVLHVDDMYRHDPNDFPTLRRLLSDNGFQIQSVAEFDAAAREYQRTHFPEVLIMDIMDEDLAGKIEHRGVATAELIEDSNQPSPQDPCIIYYTGVSKNDPSIKRIRDRNPYTPIVFKSVDPLRDAKEIYSHFPLSLKSH